MRAARPHRLLPVLAVLALLAAPAGAAGAGASGVATTKPSPAQRPATTKPSPAQQLAATYSPILMVRKEEEPPCDTSGEQYLPTSVGTVLGNPAVELKQALPGGGERLVTRAPTGAEIAGRGEDFNLDLPGNPLGDTCVYARDFAKLVHEGKAPIVTYAHIAHERGRAGLALQYWFFWYFNQFNDVHEGDWEGMQIAFESSSPRRALAEGPSQMVLFQHAGGERAKWSDAKIQKQGTHPVVYPAAGSHATFYDSAVYVENGSHGSGVGCDNTSEPLRTLVPQPVLVPNHPTATGPFKWLSFRGRWGQREKGFNDGPTGPVTKTQWREPFSWMEEQRSSSPRLPGGTLVGPQVTGAFCGAVATVSKFINLEAKSPPQALAILAALALLLVLFVLVTKWSPVDLEQLRARRSFGQLVRAARQLYGRRWRTLVPIGLTALPIVGGVNALGWLLSGQLTIGSGGRGGFELALADLVEQLGRPIAAAVLAAVVIVFVRLLVEGRPAGFLASYRGMWARFRRVVLGQLLATLAVTLMLISVVGIPFAIWKYVGWQFVQQEILFEDRPLREAFRGSSRLVRGRWWHTVRVAGFLWLVSTVAGPLLGFALIFTNFSLFWINVIGSVVYSLLIPYVALGRTLLYFDLQARADEEPVRRARWRPFRRPRATAGGVAPSG